MLDSHHVDPRSNVSKFIDFFSVLGRKEKRTEISSIHGYIPAAVQSGIFPWVEKRIPGSISRFLTVHISFKKGRKSIKKPLIVKHQNLNVSTLPMY